MEQAPFQQLIKARCGLEFQEDKIPLLTSGLKERMEATDTLEAGAYLERLRADALELAELIDLITINESYFFREPEQIRLLVETLIPELLAREPGRRLRLLSLGCAHGEEPYSLAMALEERLGPEQAMEMAILGTDIDRKALELARQGIYRDFAFRGLEPGLLHKYFLALDPERHQILQRLRARVEFQHLNLLETTWPAALMGQDVIFFRNVSIYFDARTREQIQRQIIQALHPGGILFMSATETLSNDFGLMRLDQQQGIFFFRNLPPALAPQKPVARPGSPSEARPRPEARGSLAPPEVPRPEIDPDRLFAQALGKAQAGQVDEALALASHLRSVAGATQEHLLLLASLCLLKEDFARAVEVLGEVLEKDDLEPRALFLLGQVRRWQGESELAVEALKKVIFSQPDHWQAHYLLADSHRQLGRQEQALRSYRRVVQILEQSPAPTRDPIMKLTEMPPGKIALLAKHRLSELQP